MHITIRDFKNGETIVLPKAINNIDGNLRVALCEFLYYPQWFNISEELQNNEFSKYNNTNNVSSKFKLPDGYYNVRKLNDFFKDYNVNITMNESTGKISIKLMEEEEGLIHISEGLARTFGFEEELSFLQGASREAVFFPNLINHKEMFIHLDCINTTNNIINTHGSNSQGSTVLRTVPIGVEEINSGKHEEFTRLQYKEMTLGHISNMKISILDSKNKPLEMGYMSLLLHFTESEFCNENCLS